MLNLQSEDDVAALYTNFDVAFESDKTQYQCKTCEDDKHSNTYTCSHNDTWVYGVTFNIRTHCNEKSSFKRIYQKSEHVSGGQWRYKAIHSQFAPLGDLAKNASNIAHCEIDAYKSRQILRIEMLARYDNIYVWPSTGFIMEDTYIVQIVELFSGYIKSIRNKGIKGKDMSMIEKQLEDIQNKSKNIYNRMGSIVSIYKTIEEFDLNQYGSFGNYINTNVKIVVPLYMSI
jgi:hypothetical protein